MLCTPQQITEDVWAKVKSRTGRLLCCVLYLAQGADGLDNKPGLQAIPAEGMHAASDYCSDTRGLLLRQTCKDAPHISQQACSIDRELRWQQQCSICRRTYGTLHIGLFLNSSFFREVYVHWSIWFWAGTNVNGRS